jgi:hypothetical protein
MFRIVADPMLAGVLTFACQFGIAYAVLIPPPLPDHAVSDDQGPFAALVLRLVPPTTVTYGSSEGVVIFPVYAPLSPEA